MEESKKLTRLKICYSCPIYSNKDGGTCNSKLYLNPDTNDVSTFFKVGYYKGCGCKLQTKTQ